MKLATGVDLVDISRIRDAIERHGARFIARIFTETEQRECNGRFSSLAARFAAKEAAAKALGCGIGDVGWLDIEVRGDENHAPHLYLHGEGERLAKKLGLSDWSVSLSHTETQAIAFVVAVGK
ncbi:MAG: holo-ACP synthase [Anaerolineales bacterium]|uniref:holo-ACP synthase n=1 Tax=Candidatus Villigracilis proximus TaxID=3140683 RepID=UPI00313599A0|nr:holo-ACP synthase [Anaerolineales bacterium]